MRQCDTIQELRRERDYLSAQLEEATKELARLDVLNLALTRQNKQAVASFHFIRVLHERLEKAFTIGDLHHNVVTVLTSELSIDASVVLKINHETPHISILASVGLPETIKELKLDKGLSKKELLEPTFVNSKSSLKPIHEFIRGHFRLPYFIWYPTADEEDGTLVLYAGNRFEDPVSKRPFSEESLETFGAISSVILLRRDNIAKTQETLRKREDRIDFLAEILKASPISVVATDKDGKIIYCNPATEKLFGYQEGELLGKHPGMLNTEPNAAAIAKEVGETVRREGVWRGEILCRKKNGDLFHNRLSVYQIGDREGSFIAMVGFQEDVTDRKRAEEALRESEEKYRAIFENTGAATVIIEDDTTISLANAEFERLAGYSREELEGKKSWTEFVPKDDLERTEGYHYARRTDPDSAPRNYERQFIDREGNVRDIFSTVAMIPGTRKSVASALDITEHKRTLKALRESEGKRDAMLRSIADHMSMMDKDLNIIWANETAKRIFGADIVGKKCYESYHKRREPCESCLTLKTFRDERVHEHDTQVIGKDGRSIYFHCTAHVALRDSNGRPTAVLEISRDITEHKRTMEALEESERRYRLLAENVTDIIWTMDLNLQFTYVSPSVNLLLGYGVEEAMALRVDEILTSPSLEVALKAFEEELNVEKMGSKDLSRSRVLELELNRKDGSTVWAEAKVTFLRDSAGSPFGILGVARDITERKRAEEAIKQRNTELSVLNAVACTVSQSLEIDSILDQVLNKLLDLLPIDMVGIRLTSEAKLRLAFAANCKASYLLKEMVQDIRPEDPALKPVLEDGRPITFEGRKGDANSECFAVIPVMSKGTVHGILIVHKDTDSSFSPDEVELFTTVGNQIGVAVDNAWLYQELKQQWIFNTTLIDTMPDGMVVLDGKGRLEFGNSRLLKLLGDPSGESVGMHWSSLIHSGDHPLVRAQRESGKRAQPSTYECQLLRKDGAAIPALISWALRFDGEGQYQGTIGIVTDITERKQAEEALRKSEREKDAILNSMSELVVYQDTNHRVVWANRVAYESVGLTPDQLLGRHCYEVWHGRGKPCAACPVGKARETGQPQEGEMITPDGRMWFIRGYPVRDANNGITGLVEVALDITENRRTEEKLRQYEARYAHLLGHMPDGVALVSRRRIIRVNPSMARLFGYPSPDNMDGVCTSDLAAPGSKKIMNRRSTLRTLGKGRSRFEFQALRKDGSSFPAEVTVTIDRSERQPFVLAIIRDVTDRKAHEEQRKLLSERVMIVQERERASIARELHDELGQALTGIKMDMAWIKSHLRSPDEAVSDRLEALENLTDSTLESVREMAVSLRPSVLDRLGLGAALEWYAREFERRTGIECFIESESPDFNTDSNVAINAYRIFQEALTNIARHAGASRVDVRMVQDGRYFTISISDNGKGIPSQKLSGPMSLGIAGMRERAELVKGRLDIKSRKGSGTKVTAYLPFST